MIETPKIIETTARPLAIIPIVASWQDMPKVMGPGIAEILAAITAQGIQPAGEMFTRHLRQPTETFDFEISVPVATPITPAGRVQPSEWPAMTMVRTVYHGPYEGLGDAWPEFMEWIAANGHTTSDELWESYTVGPHSTPDSSAWRTELSRRVI